MRHQKFLITTLTILSLTLAGLSPAYAQTGEKSIRHLRLKAKSPAIQSLEFRLMQSELQQEQGNAAPVLLRMPHEQQAFMATVFNKLHEYSDLPITDPKLSEVNFNSFARQIIRAGNMSHADWQYPLQSKVPYMILLPDVQTQRQWVGRGMTVWIKQQLAKGDTKAALEGIRAQLDCSRHISRSPLVVCNLVGVAIATTGLENLELAMQVESTPNLYWSLSLLPNTLVDIGPMVRWENNALRQSLPSIPDPLPPVGDARWTTIAGDFIKLMSDMYETRYTQAEAEEVIGNIDRIATKTLLEGHVLTEEELKQTSVEERTMRWILIQHTRFTAATESLIHMPLDQAVKHKKAMEAEHAALMQQTKTKNSPLAEFQMNGIVACNRFGRLVRILQTIEAIRDYVAQHNGMLPTTLAQLNLPVPNDPFTNRPFLYSTEGDQVVLQWEELPELKYPAREYRLQFNYLH